MDAKSRARSVEKQLSPYDLGMAKLAESGMNGADAKLLGLSFLTSKQTVALSAGFKDRPSIKIPYYGMTGKPTGFYRIRYLGQPEGLDALVKKPQRYAQAAGTHPELYLPRGVPWKKLAADSRVPLWVTEGEFKAAAACKVGLATIGLGGVWSWRSSKDGTLLLPALEAVDWSGREVFLAFDSDLRTNTQVLRALLALSKMLTTRGAAPKMVELPDAPDGRKQGLDDFLVARGRDALDDLAADAEPFSQAEALWKMNGEVVYVRDPGLIIVLADGRKMPPRAFKEHAYANRFYTETKIGKQGNIKAVDKPLAAAWLEWPRRAELARITYAPGEEKVTASGAYNYWPGWGSAPKRGDVVLWTELLDYLFAGSPESRRWFEQWCAWPLQNPGGKLYTAAVMWGVATGTGKSLVGYSLARIYGRNFTEITDQELASPFNEWAECRQFVMGDDVAGSEHKKGTADRLKAMITRQELRLNPKYIPSYVVPDRINYYFTSNAPDAFMIEDADRRYFVHEAPAEQAPRDFYRRYDAWYKSAAGAAALFHHLLALDLSGFDPKDRAPEPAAKKAMMRDSKSDLADWVLRLREDPDRVLKLGDAALVHDLYTTNRLLALYDPEGRGRVTANGLGRELKRSGLRQVNGGGVVHTRSGAGRYYAVRNVARWAKAGLREVQAHLEGEPAAAEPKQKKY